MNEGFESRTSDEKVEEILSRIGEDLRKESGKDSLAFSQRLRERIGQPTSIENVYTESSDQEHEKIVWGILSWTAASIAAAILLFVTFNVFLGQSAIGNVVYQQGNVTVSSFDRHGNSLRGGTLLTTQTDGHVLTNLDADRVQVYLSSSSQMAIEENDQISLADGSIWVSVVPDSGHFAVNTQAGEVTVTGTSFGISGAGQDISIFLASGQIHLNGKKGKVVIAPGQLATIDGATGEVKLEDLDETSVPQWVHGLYGDFRLAYNAAYFPSSVRSN